MSLPLTHNRKTISLEETAEDIDGLFETALACHRQGQLQEALPLYRSVLGIDPVHMLALNNTGLILQQSGQYREAVECFQRLIDHYPELAEAHYNLGNVRNQTGERIDAAWHYHNALQLKPDYPDAMQNLRVTLKQLNHSALTIELAAPLQGSAHWGIAEHMLLGRAYYDQGQVEQALGCFQKVIALDPQQTEAWFFLGAAFQKQGDLDRAEAAYQQVLQLDPDNAASYHNLGLVLADLGRIDDAIGRYVRLADLRPDYTEAHIDFNIILNRKASPSQRIACYRRVLALQPEIPEINYYMGRSLHEQKQYAQSTFHFQKAREINPNFAERFLKRVRIETSSACNLRCRHCPTGVSYQQLERSVMGMAVFDVLLRQMQDIPTLRECILYLGGEPLLNQNLPLMCRRVKQETPVTYTQLNTNGMLLTEATCRKLAEAAPDHIGISIDGRSPEENNRIRKGADYEQIRQNIYRLRSHLPQTLISIDNTLVKRPVDPEVPEPPDFLLTDFPGYAIQTIYAMKWPGLAVDRSALANLSIESTTPACHDVCPMPFDQLAVRVNGDVGLCCNDLLGEQKMGSILRTPLRELWKSEAYRQLRINMLEKNIQELPAVCRKCRVYTGDRLVIQRETET